jgi:hypothetical protein
LNGITKKPVKNLTALFLLDDRVGKGLVEVSKGYIHYTVYAKHYSEELGCESGETRVCNSSRTVPKGESM